MWLILRGPIGVHMWDFGDPETVPVQEWILAARAHLGYPVGDSWVHGDEWDASFVQGEPHESLMAIATVHDVAELATVNSAAYVAEHEAACREERILGAAHALAGLDDETLAAVLAHPVLAGRT